MANESGAPSSTTGAASGSSSAQLEQMVDQIHNKIHDIRRAQAGLRTLMIVGALGIIGMMLLFGVAVFSSVRTNLTQVKVEEAMQSKLQVVLPELATRLREASAEAAPVYRDKAMEKFSSIWPTLEKKIKDQANRLPEDLHKQVTADLDASIARVSTKVQKDLKTAFPTLTDDKLVALGDKVKDNLSVEGLKLKEHLDTLFKAEQDKVVAAFAEFPIGDYDSAKKDELEKQFIRKMLALVDHEVEMWGTKDGLDAHLQSIPLQAAPEPEKK